MEKKIVAGAGDADQRLDKFLLSRLPQYSRAFLKEQIKQGNIFVNDKVAKPSYELKENDEVIFALPDQPEAKLVPNPDIKLNVIFEDENILVIDKPAGLSVHPRMDKSLRPVPIETKNTLVSGLLAAYPAVANVGDNPAVRPGLVHRLDKDTSGVMIIAKNQNAFEWLKHQFQNHQVAKKYVALVHGQLKEKQGEIKCFLKRSPDPTKQQVAKEGREAISEYKVIKEFKDYTLLEVVPKTGRFHQIRVQLAWLGHPVVGDQKYGPPKADQKPVGLTRQFLHAQELTVMLPASPTGGPDGQKRLFKAPLPPDLADVLQGLEKSQS